MKKLNCVFNLDDFEKLLLQYQNKRVLVINPLGEHGDTVILLGMVKKLKELKINYGTDTETRSFLQRQFSALSNKLSRIGLMQISTKISAATNRLMDDFHKNLIQRIQNTSAEVIIIRGGGYLNDFWKDYRVLTKTISAIREKPKIVLILAPHTFYFTYTDFPKFFNLNNEVHIFCREKYSYEKVHALIKQKNIHVHLSKDTAFYLSKKDLDIIAKPSPESYVLIAPRTDKESAVNWEKLKAQKSKGIVLKDAIYTKNIADYITLVSNATTVYTDRLHVAILSAILGKKTYMYPNSYYKNKGVYEFSLYKFPNIDFIDSHEMCL